MRTNNNYKGFTVLHSILAILAVGLIVGTGWYVWQFRHKNSPSQQTTCNAYVNTSPPKCDTTHRADTITSFDECVKAGNPVQESFPEKCTTKDGKSFTNVTQTTQQYLVLKEWGIRIPVSKADNDDDMVYTYKKTDSYESVFFTFKRLQDYGICKSDIGVALSRQLTENKPPYDIENPETFKKVGMYWYALAYGGSYCYNADNKAETDFYNGTKITSKTVTNALKNIEAVPTE